MNSAPALPTRYRIAIAFSIVAHLCALWLFAPFIGAADLGFIRTDDDSIVLTTIEHRPIGRIRLVEPQRALRTPMAARTTPWPRHFQAMLPSAARLAVGHASRSAAAPPATSATRRARSIAERDRRARETGTGNVRAVGPFRVSGATVPQIDRSMTEAPPESMPAAVAAVALPSPTATPTAAPTPTLPPTQTSSGARFGGLFSQNYPPAIAQLTDLQSLRARMNSHVRLRIDVDETGHATGLRILGSNAQADLPEDLRAALLSLQFVPADCNGLHCDGTLEVDL